MIEQYLEKLIAIYPSSSNQDDVLRLLQYVKKHCERHGLKVDMLSFNGVYSLYANPKPKKYSTVLLQAHVDVVPTSLEHQKALTISGDKLYGRGVFDMLFATACYMHFIASHHDKIARLDIALLLTGDEELGGFDSVGKILDQGYTANVCILPDAGLKFGTLTIAAKGVYNVKIRVNGLAHHGARPWEGDGAAAKLVAFLHEFQKTFNISSRDESTLTVATLEAGDAENRGPSVAMSDLDIRYKDKDDLNRITKSLDELLKKYTAEIIHTKESKDYRLDLDSPYIQQFIEMYQKTYKQPIDFEKAHGSSDARFFSDKSIPVILFRPDGGNAHGDNEWVSRESLQQFYELIEQYVLEVAKIENSNE